MKFNLSFSSLVLVGFVSLFNLNIAQATIYQYENNSPRPIMNDYSLSWDTNSQMLNLSSSWDASANLDSISFLISDGYSPWTSVNNDNTEEQFLWHNLDLITGEMTVSTYKGTRTVLHTFTGLSADITNGSINLSLDHSYLNSLTVGDLNAANGSSYTRYSGMGFGDEVGVWYYMYSNGVRLETLDVHHGQTSKIPEPNVLFLFAIGMLAFAKRGLVLRK